MPSEPELGGILKAVVQAWSTLSLGTAPTIVPTQDEVSVAFEALSVESL